MATASTTEAARPAGGVRGTAREVVRAAFTTRSGEGLLVRPWREFTGAVRERTREGVTRFREAWKAARTEGLSRWRTMRVAFRASRASNPEGGLQYLAASTPAVEPKATSPATEAANPQPTRAAETPAATGETPASPASAAPTATEARPAGGTTTGETPPAAKPAEAAPAQAQAGSPETPAQPARGEAPQAAEPATRQGENQQLQQQGAQRTEAVSPTEQAIQAERRVLAEGIRIGHQDFQIDAAATHEQVVTMFADGVAAIGRTPNLSQLDRLAIQYAVQRAQLAGVSRAELQAVLEANHATTTNETTTNEEGKTVTREVVTQNPAVAEIKSANASSDLTTIDRADVEARRMQLLRDIIHATKQEGKLQTIEDIIPAEDIRATAAPIVEQAMARAFPNPRNSARAQELVGLVTRRPAAELALIIENPAQFATPEGLKVAEMVRKRIKHTKGWRRLSKEEKAKRLENEQYTALTITPEHLEEMKKKYRAAQPWLWIIIQILGLTVLNQGYELLLGEMSQAGQGKIQ